MKSLCLSFLVLASCTPSTTPLPTSPVAAPAPVAATGKASAPSASGVVEMAVTERGFEPANVPVKKGQPVKLVITRKTDATCAKDIVIPDEGIQKPLPLNQPVEVAFTPAKTGELKYGCAMNQMVGGVIIVE